MKDHEIRELINDLRDIALEYYNHQSLRERISNRLSPALLRIKSLENYVKQLEEQIDDMELSLDGFIQQQ